MPMTPERPTDPAQGLRRQAEDKVRKGAGEPVKDLGRLSPKEVQRLLYELQVHQIELEMQNEELRRAQSELEDSRIRYFNLYDLAPVGYLTLNDKGLILEANLCAARLLGLERQTLVKKPLSRFILPEDQDIHYRHRKQLWETGEPQAFEMRMLRAGAPPFWVRAEAATGADADGEPVCRIVVSDITKSRQAQAEMAWLATFPRLNPNPVVEADMEGRIVFINPAAKRLFPDLELRQAAHPWLADWESVILRLRQGPDEVLIREIVVGERDYQQTLVWTEKAGRVRMYGTDFTERKRLETKLSRAHEALEQKVQGRTEELQEANEELHRQVAGRTLAVQAKAESEAQFQQAQKMEAVGLLAGGIAHDFGNILACIVGNNYFVLEGLKPGHPLRPYCLEIKRSAEVAATLTRQLLGVSGNRAMRQNSILDPNSVILAMAKMLHRLLGENIEIVQDLHPSVWPVKMDSGQLEQIILNLAVNARDAMPQGGRLTLATKNLSVKKDGAPQGQDAPAPGSYVVLEFRDTGTGMDAAVLARIFEPFFTTKGSGRGTGLGLSTVKGIVEEYHGNVSVATEPGKGTAFRVCLPSVKGGAAALHRGPAVKKGRGGDESILIVEDNGSLVNILKKTLLGGGYSVFSARTAEEAIPQCEKIKERIDILLTDVVLPGMDGVELAQKLKERWPGLRVIYMSGYPGNALAPIAGFGNCVFLEKPFSPQELLDTLRQVMSKSQGDLF
jgi:PAS domain S-box-containing protein